ncbi:site-specific integrase [Thalassococcus sp. S3]|uniref:site-specific integrase n=1 Tax=Thalassococcus sp. S3 TaxID=2017482 RepID=UPI0013EE651E|nr:site-specific integrase [Thalassococcus sp. S3]
MRNPLAPHLRAQLYASRKSFSPEQERRLIAILSRHEPQTRLLCELLYLTGCRISEALMLRRDCLDTDASLVVFHTLKQRGHERLRAVPVPPRYLRRLMALPTATNGRFWPYSRWTALRRIKPIFEQAGIPSQLSNTKTFRHSYNDRGKLNGTPDYVRRALLGHRTQQANDHYGALIGDELTNFATKNWGVFS